MVVARMGFELPAHIETGQPKGCPTRATITQGMPIAG